MQRSTRRCEAVVQLPHAWTRCGRHPVEVHHALPRGRGGNLLDSVGETYHLIALCPMHHREVDNYGSESGLMISGYVRRDGSKIIYEGPDDYLSATYSAVELSVVRSILRGAESDQGSRGAM